MYISREKGKDEVTNSLLPDHPGMWFGLCQNQHDLKIAIKGTLPAWQQWSLLCGRSLRI